MLALGGCASTPSAARPAPPVAVTPTSESVERARQERIDRERLRELETAFALARAEARALRDELRAREASERARTVRIAHEPEPPSFASEEPPPDESGPRPVLRLYGPTPRPAAATANVAPIPGPPAPPLAPPPPPASLRLPVDERAGRSAADGVPAIPPAPLVVASEQPRPGPQRVELPAAEPPRADAAVQAYREALRHLTERRFEEALEALEAFLRAHPNHPYADNAMYWRGEIHYARREYARALAALNALVERYPRGNKVPEALLRIGQCHARMGDRARARQAFERLRTEHPTSVAARMLPEEDV